MTDLVKGSCVQCAFAGWSINLQPRAHLTPWRRWQSPVCSNSSVNRLPHGIRTRTPQSSESTLRWRWSRRYTPDFPGQTHTHRSGNEILWYSHLSEPVFCENLLKKALGRMTGVMEICGIYAASGGNSDRHSVKNLFLLFEIIKCDSLLTHLDVD